MKRPRVIANFALSADGKVSTRNHTPAGFTSPADKRRLLEIRALGDAILAGGRTVAADTMSMTIPAPDLREARLRRGMPANPLRVIVSNTGNSLERGLKIFRTGTAAPVVFSTRRMPTRMRATLAPLCDLWIFDRNTVPLATVLEILTREFAVHTLICEGGPTLFRAMVALGAIDELRLTWAGTLFGGACAPTLTGTGGAFLPKPVRARLVAAEPAGPECFLTYRLRARTVPPPLPSNPTSAAGDTFR